MLTERQVAYVQRAADLLPVSAQPQFQQSVANMLGYAQHPLSDRDVLDVLRLVLAQRGISIGVLLPKPKREYARLQKEKSHAATPQLF